MDPRLVKRRLSAIAVFWVLGGVAAFLIAVLVFVASSPSANRSMSRFASDLVRVGNEYAAVVVVPRALHFFSDLSQSDHMGVDLILYPEADPKNATRVVLTSDGTEMNLRNAAKVIGQDGKWLWVHGDSLKGWDFKGRRLVGVAELTGVNPEMDRMWMTESKYYSIDAVSQQLLVTIADGRKFLIEPESLKAREYQAVKPETATSPADYAKQMQKQMEVYRENMSMFGVGPEKFIFAGERVSDDVWMGLLTEENVEEMKRSWSPPDRVWGPGKRRKFYTVNLEEVKNQWGDRSRKVSSVVPMGADTYLEGGLLRAEKSAKALRLKNPEGYVVMYKFRLDGTMMLARIDMQGKKLWDFDTGIAEVDQIIPGDRYLGLVDKKNNLYSIELGQGTVAVKELP